MKTTRLTPAQHYALKLLRHAEGGWGWMSNRTRDERGRPNVAWSTANVLTDLELVTQGTRDGSAYCKLTDAGRRVDRWRVRDPR